MSNHISIETLEATLSEYRQALFLPTDLSESQRRILADRVSALEAQITNLLSKGN